MDRLLKVRRKLKKKKPDFKRQEYFKHAKLKTKWRQPRGKRSKQRMKEKARGKMPSVGFSSPRKVRGLSPEGLPVLRIFNPSGLQSAQGKTVLVASGVGRKKREEILKKAEELGIKVSN